MYRIYARGEDEHLFETELHFEAQPNSPKYVDAATLEEVHEYVTEPFRYVASLVDSELKMLPYQVLYYVVYRIRRDGLPVHMKTYRVDKADPPPVDTGKWVNIGTTTDGGRVFFSSDYTEMRVETWETVTRSNTNLGDSVRVAHTPRGGNLSRGEIVTIRAYGSGYRRIAEVEDSAGERHYIRQGSLERKVMT